MASKKPKIKEEPLIINADAWRASLEMGGFLPPMEKPKKKLKNGGVPDPMQEAGKVDPTMFIAPGAEVLGAIVDASMKDKEGTFSINEGKATLQGGLDMAAQGAQLGSVFGPLGTGIGAGVGFIGGSILGNKGAQKQQKALNELYLENFYSDKAPNIETTFNKGGMLPISMYVNGGKMELMPRIGNPGMGELTELEGPKHEQGGIPMGPNAEVEGGEVKLDDYIFSDTLVIPNTKKTFADVAKNIKKKYEDRPLTDGPSKRSRDAELLKLMQLNEVERQKEEQAQAEMEMRMGKDMATFGGFIDINDEGILQVDDKVNQDFILAAEEMGMTPQKYAAELYKCGGMINKYANGGHLNFSSKGDYHKWLGYVHAKGLAESTPGNQKISIAGKEHKVKHAPGGFLGGPPVIDPSTIQFLQQLQPENSKMAINENYNLLLPFAKTYEEQRNLANYTQAANQNYDFANSFPQEFLVDMPSTYVPNQGLSQDLVDIKQMARHSAQVNDTKTVSRFDVSKGKYVDVEVPKSQEEILENQKDTERNIAGLIPNVISKTNQVASDSPSSNPVNLNAQIQTAKTFSDDLREFNLDLEKMPINITTPEAPQGFLLDPISEGNVQLPTNVTQNSSEGFFYNNPNILDKQEFVNPEGRLGYSREDIDDKFPNGGEDRLTDEEFKAIMDSRSLDFPVDNIPGEGGTIFDLLPQEDLDKLNEGKRGKSKIGAEEIALAASSMPGIVNLLQSFSPEVTKFDRVNLDTISLENQRKATERDLAKARAIAKEATRGSGRSRSEVLANLSSVNAALTDKEISADLQSFITEETTNKQIKNQEKQINQQTSINEYIANEQNRSRAKDLQALASADISNNLQGYVKDKKMNAVNKAANDQILELIKNVDQNYTIVTDPKTGLHTVTFKTSV